MSSYEIHTLDLNFQGAPEGIASFLVLGPGAPVLVETGPGSTLPVLLQHLERRGIRPADVRDVLVTHIHLDHAGAAGWWAQQGARVHVHAVGAPHLIDPSRLLSSARRIYQEMMDPLWGDFLASPAERVRALDDGDTIEAGGLRFTAYDTPGHARHHMLYRLEDVAFTGDLAGIRLSGRNHVRMPTPPPEFELEMWLESVRRVKMEGFRRLYLTHFGAVDEAQAHWTQVVEVLHLYVEAVRDQAAAGVSREAIIESFTKQEDARLAGDGIDEAGRALYTGVGPLGMSVDGLLRYLHKQRTA